MAGMPQYLIFVLLAILVSGGIVLQVLACVLYNNWWPMLTVMSGDSNSWEKFTKFLTGASVVGSIAIPTILKHAGIIGWGALWLELSSFFVFGAAILWFLHMNNEDEYSMF